LKKEHGIRPKRRSNTAKQLKEKNIDAVTPAANFVRSAKGQIGKGELRKRQADDGRTPAFTLGEKKNTVMVLTEDPGKKRGAAFFVKVWGTSNPRLRKDGK